MMDCNDYGYPCQPIPSSAYQQQCDAAFFYYSQQQLYYQQQLQGSMLYYGSAPWIEHASRIEAASRQTFLMETEPKIAFILESARACSLATEEIQQCLDSLTPLSAKTQRATQELIVQFDAARKKASNHALATRRECAKVLDALSECHKLKPEDAGIAKSIEQVKAAQESCKAVSVELSKLRLSIKKTTKLVEANLPQPTVDQTDQEKPKRKKISIRNPDTRKIVKRYPNVISKLTNAQAQIATTVEAIDASILAFTNIA